MQPTNEMLSTVLKRKVGNCCTQRTKPIKQKKRNSIKMLHQLKYALARYDTKD